MKNTKIDPVAEDFDIGPFDFENSLPNKYAQLYSEDNKTIIIKSDQVKTIVLDSDIASYFPDSKSVNFALRSIIKAIPKKSNSRKLVQF
ncbi:MAG: hypothetical protein NT007_06160 [Candidatus Kapabacteria bacterium]|nr:hypothetical protein [Candidatus Kapabacteria bacterium]